jgi:hypothetical protein
MIMNVEHMSSRRNVGFSDQTPAQNTPPPSPLAPTHIPSPTLTRSPSDSHAVAVPR